jgi:serine protease Do
VLPNGDKHYALVERRSHPLQAAILKLDSPPDVPAVDTPEYFEITETPAAQKGDWVMGISNAFKVANGSERLSVTLGVVSLRTQLEAKRGASDVDYDQDVLLIDCITSNPGAPGGAVITVDGRLAGMIGKVIESKSTQTRLNYAVPNDLLHKFLIGEPIKSTAPKTYTGGKKAVLGIRLFTLGGRRAPAYIDRVKPGSPAAKAGLRSDDLILSIGGQRVRYASEYKKLLAQLEPGKPVTIIVKRKAKAITIQVTPEAAEK